MEIIVRLINSGFQTYLLSLKKDLGKGVFDSILLIAVLSWAGLFVALGLVLIGEFHMPSDPLFYLFWFLLTFSTALTFTAFLLGMLNTTFFAANNFENTNFAVTAAFAIIFLHEGYNITQITAIGLALFGSVLFFHTGGITKNFFRDNKGAFLILFSLVLAPLEYVLYKSASLYTTDYYQFLTGRLVMDAVFYTLFFVLVVLLWYRRNPLPAIKAVVSSRSGVLFIIGSTVAELIESWLVFKMSLALFAVLGTISIPMGYFIGRKKYSEREGLRQIIGGVLIVVAVLVFACSYN